jgi:sugar lactone lactonase YvrE
MLLLVCSACTITTIAGTGGAGFSGDGSLANAAALYYPFGVAVDADHNVYIADTYNHRIRKVAAIGGTITTVAGTGIPGSSGDGGLATAAPLYEPRGVAVDADRNVYIADTNNHRIRKVAASDGTITTVAGTGSPGFSGDGSLATAAQLSAPTGIAVDADRNVYIADRINHRIRKVAAISGIISTVAGTTSGGFWGDGSLATAAKLQYPSGVAVDADRNVYIADHSNQRIRKVAASDGIITTIAGTGGAGFSGDGSLANAAALYYPFGVAVDANRNVYIADQINHRVRKVAATDGTISTVAGTGSFGFSGDGGLAIAAMLNYPLGVAVDADHNVYIADTPNNRIRKVAAC